MVSVCILCILVCSASAIYYKPINRNGEYERWSVRTYLVDDYRKSFECHGQGQYCKGDYCTIKMSDGPLECYHALFYPPNQWSHDDHSYCNCYDLTCTDGSTRVTNGKEGEQFDIGCVKVAGEWSPDASSISQTSKGEKIEITEGFKKTEIHSWGSSQSFSSTVKKSLSAGFAMEGFSVGTHVDQTESTFMSEYTKGSIKTEQSSSTTRYFDYDGSGQIWVWRWKVSGSFGSTTINTLDYAQTHDALHAPCCLPGHFVDYKNPRSSCQRGPNFCGSSLSCSSLTDNCYASDGSWCSDKTFGMSANGVWYCANCPECVARGGTARAVFV